MYVRFNLPLEHKLMVSILPVSVKWSLKSTEPQSSHQADDDLLSAVLILA